MGYRLTNKLLKKHGKRVFWGQILWGLVIGAVGIPVSYLWGVQQTQKAFDPEPLMEYWKESAQAEPAVVVPSREVATLIMPFGLQEPETGSLNGCQIWTVRYPAESAELLAALLPQIGEHWMAAGFEIRNGGRSVMAQRGDGVTLLAQATDQQVLELHCWVPEKGAAAVSHQLFTAQGLPAPPPGARIMNFSSPESTAALAYLHDAGIRAVMNDYTAALRRAGWQEMPMGDSVEAGMKRGVVTKLFRDGQRKVSVSFNESPNGQTLVSVMVL